MKKSGGTPRALIHARLSDDKVGQGRSVADGHDALIAWWQTATLAERRQLIDRVVSAVVSASSGARGPVLNPDRVDIRWRV